MTLNLPQFEVRNKYHSQGLAAGGSALLDAITRGKVHLAKFILDAGEYDVVNTRDFKGKTPLIRACYIKEEGPRDKATELLISRGADVNMMDESGRTALSYACELRTNDVVKILLKTNVDPDIPDKKGNTPLIYSAMAGNDLAIEILIKSFRRLGLNVDHINKDGMSALLIAAKKGFIECATILALEGRACVSFRDREKGRNAEEWARARGCSSPEVLPFTANAELWNLKFSRYDLFASRAKAGGDEGADNRSEERTAEEQAAGPRQIDMEELNRRLAEIQNQQMEWGYNHPSLARMGLADRMRHKRGSLPAMKFFNFSQRETDGRFPKIRMEDDSVPGTSLLSVTPAAVHAAGKRHSCYPESAMAPKDGLTFPAPVDMAGPSLFLNANQNNSRLSAKPSSEAAPVTALQVPNGNRARKEPPNSCLSVGGAKPVTFCVTPEGDTDSTVTVASASKIDFDLDSSGTVKSQKA